MQALRIMLDLTMRPTRIRLEIPTRKRAGACPADIFRSIINNMGMVLAKSDMTIARRYADVLVEDPELRGDVFGRISAENELTLRWHEHITGLDHPLADNPLLARSLRNRCPYLDPLHVMQVDLLRRYRQGEREELVRRGIQRTINAIATGIRNSG